MADETDPVIASIVRALRVPVDLGPDLEHRVLAILATEPRPAPRASQLPRTIAWAAVVAGVTLYGAAVAWRAGFMSSNAGEPIRAVELTLETGAPTRVAVVGDFNNWDPRATMLKRHGSRWTTTLQLRPGRYRYTFLVDDARWVADPESSPAADPDFDRPTSVLTVSR